MANLVAPHMMYTEVHRASYLTLAEGEMRLERAMRRDGADREKVLQRMNAQKLMNDVSAGHDDPRIDVKVVNDGDVGQLRDRLVEIFG